MTDTGTEVLDANLEELAAKSEEFARLDAGVKADLARQSLDRLLHSAAAWVADGARAKGLTGNLVAEEWLAGPLPTARMLRHSADTWEAIGLEGRPPLGTGTRRRPDGRLEVDVFPVTAFERILYRGTRAHVVMNHGVTPDSAQQWETAGGVSLILGAGNVSSIPALDVVSRWLAAGSVCVLKMSPVNDWVGPHLAHVLGPFVERGYLRIVYGGGEVGQALVNHPLVTDIHITGSDVTHDLIVWGPGPDQAARKAAGKPVLDKPITSELGNVSPVAIVPADYSERDLLFQARNVATMVAQNASFNCNAAKMLITASDWPQRERFLALVEETLASIPPHLAYYPGAEDRYEQLVGGRAGVRYLGDPGPGALPWAFVSGLAHASADEPLFRDEPFCGIVSEVALDTTGPVEFLAAATEFMNERLWGTLNAMLVVPPRLERELDGALDAAVDGLRYGTVAINQWPAVAFALATTPWGGHPSATLADVQSGLGWVHNTFLLEGVEKAVLRGPLRSFPDPPWLVDNPRALAVARQAAAFEIDPRWSRLPSLMKASTL